MPILFFQIFYHTILAFVTIAAIFVIYHIIKYSYNKIAMLLMLAIFCGVFIILASANYALFSNINADDIAALLKF